jgi:hypothetical protein
MTSLNQGVIPYKDEQGRIYFIRYPGNSEPCYDTKHNFILQYSKNQCQNQNNPKLFKQCVQDKFDINLELYKQKKLKI